MTTNNKNIFIFKYLIFLISIGLFFSFWRINILSNTYNNEYNFICISYYFTVLIYIYTISKEKLFDIFHPIHILSWLYWSLFIFTPLTFINLDMTLCHGVNVMNGCIKGTIVYIIGYIGYILGYNNPLKRRVYNLSQIIIPKYCYTTKFKLSCLTIWGIGFVMQLLYLVLSGKSLVYILTLSGSGDATKIINTNIGVLNNFSFLMVYSWLIICFISFKKRYKLIITYLTFASFFIVGARFIFIIMTLSILICYTRINKVRLSLYQLTILFISLLFFSSFLGDARRSIAHGTNKEVNIDSERMAYVLQSNFDIYQIHYSVIEHYPEKYDFDYGGHIFGDTFTFWIPRFLWPNKPKVDDQNAGKMMRNTVGEAGVNAAMAWPNLTEYYCDFGSLGVFIIMLLFGILSRESFKYYYGNNFFKLILYSIFIPLIFQIITRGYTPQNTGLIIFIIAPHFLIHKLYRLIK